MANQMIALGVRPPSTPDLLGPSMRMMNLFAQQRAADRQSALAQQTMDINAAQEARASRLAEPQYEKATAEAQAAAISTAMDFNNFIRTGLNYAKDPMQAAAIAQRIGSNPKFQDPMFQGAIGEALQNMPQDPAGFTQWKDEILAQTLSADQQLKQKFIDVTTGTETFTIGVPEYAGTGRSPTEVPGTRVQAPQGITYVKDNEGNVFAMPAKTIGSTMPVGGGGGGGGAAPALQTNPGAIKDGAYARSQPGYAGGQGGFATFDTPEAGIAAQENLLRSSYVGKGFNTINKIVNKYAPQGPENSAASVSNYKSYIAKQTGIDINTPITAAQVPAVAKAMREFETGKTKNAGAAPRPVIEGGQRKLTEQEQTASYNVNRVLRAAQVIAEATSRSKEAEAPGGLEAFVANTPLISGLANFTREEDRQIVVAAQRDLIDALLYLSTGAAYNKEQLQGQMESYLPQYFDKPGNVKSKRQRLAQLVMDAKARAGRAWTPEIDAAAKSLYAETMRASGRDAAPPTATKKRLKFNSATGDFE